MKVYVTLLACMACITPCLATQFFAMPSPWGWACENGECKKKEGGTATLVTLNTCKVTCGLQGALWPLPTQATVGDEVAHFLPANLTHSLTCDGGGDGCTLLDEAVVDFQDNLQHYHPNYNSGSASWDGPYNLATLNHKLHLDVTVAGGDEWNLRLNTDESYDLAVTTEGSVTTATIIAPTFFGARHALETLSQLVDCHETTNSLLLVTNATVSDAPVFKYRGLLLDTSRNFISIRTIERTLDGMAATKLNTLHLHLTDTHSFPLELPGLPKMAYYGAYSPSSIYTPENLRHLQQYARVRGIRLMPEIDAPAHIGNGWQWGPKDGLGDLAVCINQEPWAQYCVEPPCGQLNLANPNMYEVLGLVYMELFNIFDPIEIFHYGGDEVNVNCWNTTEEIVTWMEDNNFGVDSEAYYEQWGVFQEKARQRVADAAGAMGVEPPFGLIWTSHLTESGRLERFLNNSMYGIQIWTHGSDPHIADLLEGGYKVVFSNYDAWYLDCGAGAWVGEGNNWCSPYKGWQTVYSNSPYAIAMDLTGSEYRDAILGGEAALWTEETDDANVDAKLWPRGAALGERLWSNPSTSWYAAESRFIHHRQRLLGRGIMAERIQPQWCHQNEGLCYA